MILAVDMGNTNIVVGCMDGESIIFSERLSTDHQKTSMEYAIAFHTILELQRIAPKKITGAIISSVVPPLTGSVAEALLRVTGVEPMVVGPGIRTGLNIRMDNPAQVGADLIVAAVAGIQAYTCPLIIVDMGTATTISVVDREKNYIGGMILPGVRVSLDSLTSRTSQLPRISLDAPKKLIGKNTIECMKSGILYGNASCIDGMVERIEEDLGEKATVLATGGLASVIAPLCRHEIMLDDDLILRGLWYIYRKNC